MFLNSLNLTFDCLNFANESLKDHNFNMKCKGYGALKKKSGLQKNKQSLEGKH